MNTALKNCVHPARPRREVQYVISELVHRLHHANDWLVWPLQRFQALASLAVLQVVLLFCGLHVDTCLLHTIHPAAAFYLFFVESLFPTSTPLHCAPQCT